MTDVDYSQRYPSNWAALSQSVKNAQLVQTTTGKKVRCALCGDAFAWEDTQTHHTYYTGDNDIPGQNIFAVCGDKNDEGTCHNLLHQKENYITDKNNPVFGAYNSPELVNRLRDNYALIVGQNQVQQPFSPVGGMMPGAGFPGMYQQIPNQYTVTPDGVFNAPINKDLAPGTEPSLRFKKRLFNLTSKVDPTNTYKLRKSTFNDVFNTLLFPLAISLVVVLILAIAL
jgi:hypothetical protein